MTKQPYDSKFMSQAALAAVRGGVDHGALSRTDFVYAFAEETFFNKIYWPLDQIYFPMIYCLGARPSEN